jgi:hypothetical protein
MTGKGATIDIGAWRRFHSLKSLRYLVVFGSNPRLEPARDVRRFRAAPPAAKSLTLPGFYLFAAAPWIVSGPCRPAGGHLLGRDRRGLP